MCQSICDVFYDICSTTKILDQISEQTAVELTVDVFGNLSIVDPDDELLPVYTQGNLTATGSRVNRFHLDRFGNFKYTIN